MVEDGAWEKTDDDILLIQDEGNGHPLYSGENSNDSRKSIPHFFICKYKLGDRKSDSLFKAITTPEEDLNRNKTVPA